jgi:hypothetical protein
MVSIKYVLIVLRADDEGEGGTFALYSLLSRYVRLDMRYHLNICLIDVAGKYRETRPERRNDCEDGKGSDFGTSTCR